MKTTTEQFTEYLNLIETKAQKFLDSTDEILPTEFFEVSPNGKIKKYEVCQVKCWIYDKRQYLDGKKPTRLDVEDIRQFYNSLVFTKDHIRLYYDKYNSFTITKIRESSRMFINLADAEEFAKPLIEKAEKEVELLKTGHIRCAYCSKVISNNEAVTHRIFAHRMFGGGGRDLQFCSGNCAGSYQMSTEG